MSIRTLDRTKRVDLRTLDYPAVDPNTDEDKLISELRSYTLGSSIDVLDQGFEGSCTGHGAAHYLMCLPVLFPWMSHELAVLMYEGARRRDQWVGEDYEGSSVLGVCEYMKDAGIILEYRWQFTVIEIAWCIGRRQRAVLVGCDWYTGMLDTDSGGWIRPTGNIEGGHCIALDGVKIYRNADGSLDWVRSYVEGLNSWGPLWGNRGRFRISLIDLAKLISGGDFTILLGERRTATMANILNTR